MTEQPVDREGAAGVMPEGVRGDFDASLVKDYAPLAESADPLMHVELGAFEGPLDLLLHLIKRDGVDIMNIPIAAICTSYTQMLDQMRELNIDVAAEFLVMAATLVHIKSRMLLPKEERPVDDDEVDEGDPRIDLVRRLLEYQKYRRAALGLAERCQLGRDVFARPEMSMLEGEGLLGKQDPMALVAVLADIFGRTKNRVVHEVFIERMSVGARINELIDLCRVREHITFDELLAYGEEPALLSKRVVTFLSLLEMTRLRLVRLHQPSEQGTIYVSPIHENLDIDSAEIRSSFDEAAPANPAAATDTHHVL
ncbi:MAG: segregation/condensation protein A [Pseudomonadota bacterium]